LLKKGKLNRLLKDLLGGGTIHKRLRKAILWERGSERLWREKCGSRGEELMGSRPRRAGGWAVAERKE